MKSLAYVSLVLAIFVAVVSCGPPSSSSAPSSSAHGLRSFTRPVTVLDEAHGGTGVTEFPGLKLKAQWWSAADTAALFGISTVDTGYPVGNTFRFTAAATITGVRFYCANGGTQTFTVHAASSTDGTGAQTELASKACASLAAGAIHTCTFDTPATVSDLTLAYTASVYGGSSASDCVMLHAGSIGSIDCGTAAGAPCALGPSIMLLRNGSVYGTFGSSTSLPASTDNNHVGTAEFVFTVP